MEEWRDVVGFEGLYQVSNLGRVRSLHYMGGNRVVILSLGKRQDGYLSVGLTKDKKTTTRTVHRLVAKAFIPNPNNLEMVNHKDENKANNCVKNLEWCTRSYNQIYSMNLHDSRRQIFANNFKDNKTGERTSPFVRKGVPHTYKCKVEQKLQDGTIINVFNNAAEAAMKMSLNVGHIIGACKRNARTDRVRKRRNKATSGGFVWEFVKDTI